MHGFPPIGKRSLIGRCVLLMIGVTVLSAVADEPQPFSPLSPFSAPTASRPGRFIHADGAALYQAVCQGCHMADARGAKGAGEYPALAANAKLASATFPAARVLNGWAGMPRFAEMLTDAQIADVVNYVRTSFGNHYADRLLAADVARMRVTVKSEGGK
jgi:mono/diheme cytochrome c family protein